MDELKKYLKSALGIETEVKPLKTDRLKKLPLYISSEYEIQLIRVCLLTTNC